MRRPVAIDNTFAGTMMGTFSLIVIVLLFQHKLWEGHVGAAASSSDVFDVAGLWASGPHGVWKTAGERLFCKVRNV